MARYFMLLWVVGLLTLVPYGTYYLLVHASADQYALLITLVLFWIFSYWGLLGCGRADPLCAQGAACIPGNRGST